MSLRFAKYEGLGNDFIVVDAERLDDWNGDRAQALCDRHFGIGADGVLVVTAADDRRARARMTVLNADGSRPEMCGNGLRCVALHLARADGALGTSFVVETDSGLRSCEVDRSADTAMVRAELGQASFVADHAVEIDGATHVFAQVSTGNPHLVTFDASYDERAIDRFAPRVSERVAGGANVEFARVLDRRRIDLVVWERGVGRTLACGTGAAATALAAARLDLADFDSAIEIRLPGGSLEVSVSAANHSVLQRGPARLVFAGEVAPP
jgi:diaminopimelate epimerase